MDGDDTPTQRLTRTPRLTDEEVAEAMLVAGVRMIEDEGGLTVSMHHLSYEAVIARSGVPRSAAYRVWSHKEQFNADLLVRISRPQRLREGNFSATSPAFLADLLAEAREGLADPEGRVTVAMDAIQRLRGRGAGGTRRGGTDQTVQWKTYINSRAALSSVPDGPERDAVLLALSDEEEAFISQTVTICDRLLPALGLRMREPFSTRQLVRQGAVWFEGLALCQLTRRRQPAEREELVVERSRGREEWSMTMFGLAAVCRAMTEPHPDFTPEWTDRSILAFRRIAAATANADPAWPDAPDEVDRYREEWT